MDEVTKEQFKKVYFKYGKAEDGWGADYWDNFFEPPEKPPMRYMVALPKTDQEDRMMIVVDNEENEYRLFFLSVDKEEDLFFFPEYDEEEN